MAMSRPARWFAFAAWAVAFVYATAQPVVADPPIKMPVKSSGKPAATKSYETVAIQGRVVWLAGALKKQHGIGIVAEAAQRILALRTTDGHLYPIAEDVRGRAFRRDKRLRDMTVELLVRKYDKSPVIQIIGVRNLKLGDKYDVDYWCDVCSIAMFELKPCDCCQAPIRLRQRKMKQKQIDEKMPASP